MHSYIKQSQHQPFTANMSSPHTHPRRRPIKASDSSSSTHAMSLRKSGTFSSPKSISSDICDLDNHRHMPRRSPTSPESLEELLLHDSKLRMTSILADIDQRITGTKSSSDSTASILQDKEVLPLPSFLLDNTTIDFSPMEIDSKDARQTSHDHASDSGLGSSVGSKDGRSSARDSVSTSVTSTASAITGSFTAIGESEDKHTLGEFACRQIHESIIKPILREESLKDFHPLIRDVPRRIGEKNICNLRDLEKTLIFLAPEFSASPASYLSFCERSIQLLYTTVDSLSESDQRLPSDRPYTSNYFLDLVEQIRRYAAIMAATRQKEENGEELDEMDYSSKETLKLSGGLSHDGHPLQLVREKDGMTIPLADDAPNGSSATKRALADDEMDFDEVTRSMARRRKSDKPGDVMHACRDCKKEFKRPCDLTKHEKTHSRPWKCTFEKCKYYDLGWPTEKERDRHINDKHSSAPAQYKCLYPPCTYASKRESNCKQHMEKAHGWEYVRSKSNGRKKTQSAGSDQAPPTPLTPFLSTPQSATLSTPITPFIPSPSMPLDNAFDPYNFGTPAMPTLAFSDDFRRDSITNTSDGSALTFSSGHSPVEPTSFEDAVTPEDTTINHGDVFGNCAPPLNTNFNDAFQQPMDNTTFDFSSFQYTMANPSSNVPHLSPSGQADMTLYSPHMPLDEGFGDGMDMDMNFSRPTGDFTLFGSTGPNDPMLGTAGFFPDINQFGGQFDNMYVEPTTTLDDLLDCGTGNPQ
ncbi:unnamed protein product [Periconia digitata]|uniref:C2H2-type domain-containing protein n=1 Tax=Periconia digitata TaxID=1303443 RepID=A0A9W4U8B7_9PLEO|nr:unnamed protein product [Periconia digitata]